MSFSIDKESCRKALEEAGARKVAFVHHLRIKDPNGYGQWLSESKNIFNSKRLFRVKADPVAREGIPLWQDGCRMNQNRYKKGVQAVHA